MMTKSHAYNFCVSLAYRYWDPTQSEAENSLRFGSMTSEVGLGGNLDIEVEVEISKGTSVVEEIKKYLDHQTFVRKPWVSTLETLTFKIAEKFGPEILGVSVRESSRLESVWRAKDKNEIELRWTRPV